jgi:hypothetical protein
MIVAAFIFAFVVFLVATIDDNGGFQRWRK